MNLRQIENKILSRLALIKGDKMLLLVVILLFLFSINAVLSSVSKIVATPTSRISVLFTQLVVIAFSGFLIFAIYKYGSFKRLMKWSLVGYIFSIFLLVFLCFHCRIDGIMESQRINDSWRTILFFGKIQIHVFEVVKIFSVMYMALIMNRFQEDEQVYLENQSDEEILADKRGFWILRHWAYHFQQAWIDAPGTKRALFIYLPFVATCGMVSMSSNSSLIIIAFGMIVALYIGGFSRKKLILFILTCIIGGAGMIAIKSSSSEGNSTNRVETLLSRLDAFFTPYDEGVEEIIGEMQGKNPTKTQTDLDNYIDKNRQVQGARFAIREGGISPLGKLPGGSTQKYVVMNMFGDFMFSFICEEYGIIGAVFVLLLFGFLIARGTKIAGYCKEDFARTTVASLVILISGQALLHVLVNVGIVPMTGQTLPLLSDGKSAFVMFSIGLGVVLCVSRLVREEIEMQERETETEEVETKGLE